MDSKKFIRKTTDNTIKDDIAGESCSVLKEYRAVNDDGSILRYLKFPALEDITFIDHALTTRQGGVSKGCYSEMDLSYTMGDDRACVEENYERFCKILGLPKERIVSADQKHTDTVMAVTDEDAGKGVTRGRDRSFVDGMVTNRPGLGLAIFASDCVPIYFVDPVHKAIGVCHSGWRGTVKRIAKKTIEKMNEEYGSKPSDLVCAIGPSVCRDCYEISHDVAREFMDGFPQHVDMILVPPKISETGQQTERAEERISTERVKESMFDTDENQKYLLDLWQTNRIILEEAGVKAENIHVTDICTCCNPDLLFSHRRHGNDRGNNAGFIYIK